MSKKFIIAFLSSLIILLNVLSPVNYGSNEAYATVNNNPISVPSGPVGEMFTYGDGRGYVNLSWEAVPNATGYKVWVFNGVAYESINVGNTTSWSTKGKAIWPTDDEISQGKFNIHTDLSKPGSELALNPSYAYRNAGTEYRLNKNYYFRVSAYNSTDESAYSTGFYKHTMPDLLLPEAPETETSTSTDSTGDTGFVYVQWEPVANAIGYKVWLYNGKSYESIDVGDTTEWTTEDKGLWPTKDEIANGKYKLHLDGTGSELAIDPSPVYINSKGNYGEENKNYWFRISAYNDLGETVYSGYSKPIIEPDEEVTEEEIESVIEVKESTPTREDFTSEEEYQEWLNSSQGATRQAVGPAKWIRPAFKAVVTTVVLRNGAKEMLVKQYLKSTTKKIKIKNGSLANKTHKATGIKFNPDGFPIFKARESISLPYEMIKSSNYQQFKYCNQELAMKLETNAALKASFTKGEIAGLKKGNNPPGWTWHHHQTRGYMQLVKTSIHRAVGHTGGKSIWGKL